MSISERSFVEKYTRYRIISTERDGGDNTNRYSLIIICTCITIFIFALGGLNWTGLGWIALSFCSQLINFAKEGRNKVREVWRSP